MLIDPYQRRITYVRVSVTDRCDFRCGYCMSEEMQFLPKADLLSLDELERVVAAFIDLGVKHVRLTGGEPLVRKGIMDLITALGDRLGLTQNSTQDLSNNFNNSSKGSSNGNAGVARQASLTLTTNGSQLSKYAAGLAAAGVKRVNVSLDSLDAEKFRRITRRGNLHQVLAGIAAARDVGLQVRVNAVALKDANQDELNDLVAWCGEQGCDLAFIEVMPMGDIGNEQRLQQFLSLVKVLAILRQRWTITPSEFRTPGPARYFDCHETGQRIGLISPLSHRFCESCNRVRVTCTGHLYLCLGQEDGTDLRAVLRQHSDNAPLLSAIRQAITMKPKGHDFVIDRRRGVAKTKRLMNVTGG